MEKLTEQQQAAYKKLLSILQEKGKQYVYTQGKDIEWFQIKEIEQAPYYEINYLHDTYVKVQFQTFENGYKEFVLKLHDDICKEKIITQETNSYFFAKEFETSTFVMKCLNEMFKIKDGSIFGYLYIEDDGSPLSEFIKSFMMGMENTEIEMENEPIKPRSIQEHKDAWFEENAPFGKDMGYPDCCIKEFCDQPPALLNKMKKPSKIDLRRYKAGCINGVFTGFVPCAFHAKEIVTGRITLASLITDRNPEFGPFPNHNH